MPNHVENIVSIRGDEQQVRKMFEAIENDEYGIGTIDFNKIIPMPKSLEIDAGSRTDEALKIYQGFIEVYTLANIRKNLDLLNIPMESEEAFLRMRTDIQPEEWELGKQAFQNIQKYGSPTWYEWCIKKWNTKWNAYGYEQGMDYSGNDCLKFQTAWSAPHSVLQKLSEMYPNIPFVHQWADEDLGVNCGERTYLDGNVIDEFIPEGVRAMQFAMDVWDYDPEDLGLTLNKTGTGYISMTEDEYQLIELFGKPALFTSERLTDADIPEGLYCYHLRTSDDGSGFGSIEPKVVDNHGGSIITNSPLDFGEAGYISLTDENYPNFTGREETTIAAYMRGEFTPEEGQVMQI